MKNKIKEQKGKHACMQRKSCFAVVPLDDEEERTERERGSEESLPTKEDIAQLKLKLETELDR